MTDQESISEADRSVSLFIDKSEPRHSLLVTEVARLIRYWEKEGGVRAVAKFIKIYEQVAKQSWEAEYKIEDKP